MFSDAAGEISASGGGGGGGSGGSDQPAPKKQMVASDLEERRRARLAKAKASSATGTAATHGPSLAKRRFLVERELLRMYVAQDSHPEEDDFSLLQFWERRGKASTCAETGEVEPGLPYLALIARLYHGIESTSCQAERNFSALSNLIGTLRSSMLPFKVEQMMFLRLNKLFVKEVEALHDAVEANKAAAARCKENVTQVEVATADTSVTLLV